MRYLRVYAEAQKQIVSSSGKILSSQEETEEITLMPVDFSIYQEIMASPLEHRPHIYRMWLLSTSQHCASQRWVGRELGSHLARFNSFLLSHEGWDITWVSV